MLSDDISYVDLEIKEFSVGIDFVEAWQRIKAALGESTNSSHNTASTPCPKCQKTARQRGYCGNCNYLYEM